MEKIAMLPKKYQDDNLTGSVGDPAYVAYPESVAEVVALVNEVREKGQKLLPIGAKTSVVGATYADPDTVLLSTDRLNKVLAYDEDTLTLTVEPGVTLHEVRYYLEDTPYFYAPDPGSKDASVGGTAATNAGGMRALKYGVTRDNVKGLEVVLANGEVLHVGGVNKKSASGYDLKNLFIGSEGTLGVITKLELVLRPKPQVSQSLLIGFNSMSEAAPVIFSILQSPVTPAALEFIDDETLAYSEEYLGLEKVAVEGTNYLLATVDGPDEDSVLADVARLQQVAETAGALEVKALTDDDSDLMWKLRDTAATAISAESETATYDVVVPVNRIADTLLDMKALGDESGISGVYFGHAGDGNIHALMLREDLSDEEWAESLETFDSKLYAVIAENGGLPAAEHGIGTQKKSYLVDTLGDVHIDVMRSVKQALDPHSLFNPGKVFDVE